jgi:hypothetical protein
MVFVCVFIGSECEENESWSRRDLRQEVGEFSVGGPR